MKKIYVGILTLFLCVSFIGCSSSSLTTSSRNAILSESAKNSSQNSNSGSISSASKDLPNGSYKDIGKGTMYISTPSGTSEGGNIPVIFANKNGALIQIGIDTRDFDGSKLSYVYVDGILNTKEQYGDGQSSINLVESLLSVRNHKVEVAQYDTDKPDGKMVTYKSASYEVKSK